MRSRAVVFVFALGVAACAGNSCGPDLDLDFSEPDECTPAGGTCYALFCGADSHVEDRSGCGLVGTCCMPGPTCDGRCASACGQDETHAKGYCPTGFECCGPKFVPSPSFDDGAPPPPPPPPPPRGFCNLAPCAAGCVCRDLPADDAGDAGACEPVCDCPDGGADAGVDASSAVDAAVDGAGDGGDGGDAGDGKCGVVTCADGCTCYDSATSECSCPNVCP